MEVAMLKRSPQSPKVFTLSECIIPSHNDTVKSIMQLKESSKKILSQISAAMAITLLNQKSQILKYNVGDLVYLPDKLLRKNPGSIKESLAYIIRCLDGGRNYLVKMLNGQILTRQLSNLVSANASKNQLEAQVIDPFTIVDWKQAHLPEDFNAKFDL